MKDIFYIKFNKNIKYKCKLFEENYIDIQYINILIYMKDFLSLLFHMKLNKDILVDLIKIHY